MVSTSSYAESNHRGYRHPFIFGSIFFGGVGDNPRTLSDLAMSLLSAEIRRTPGWWTNHRDQAQQLVWVSQATDRRWDVRGSSSLFKIKLSPKQIQYVIDELDGYAALRDGANECQVSCFERIWESQSLFDAGYTTGFLAELDSVRADYPPWRSDNDNTQHVVIDPLLHCLVYNRTLVRNSLSRVPKPLPPPVAPDIYTVSLEYAALPSDITVSSDGSATFKSCINNVDPHEHQAFYRRLETLLSKSIPMFEHTLTDLHRNNPVTQRIRGTCRYTVWEEPDAPEHSDDEEGWANYEKRMREWVMNRPIMLPDVPADGYMPGTIDRRRHTVRLRNRPLQVFTRVSEVRLTPGGPEYSGSDWGVEGMRSERIVACNFHYIQYKNVTPSALEFRMAVSYPRGFLAGDTGATLRTWGLKDGDGCQQHIGSVPIQEGLSVSFPNIYQSRSTPFRLQDPTQPGVVTVVAFLLVDPDIQPIVSTGIVPPQQEAWVTGAVYEALETKLPAEIIAAIIDELDGCMTLDEAEDHRQNFADTLKRFTVASNKYHFCIPFDAWNGPDSVP